MLEELCGELRNYFVKEIRHATFTIENGVLAPADFLQDGQYLRIVGSVFNDGVYSDKSAIVNPDLNIPRDETFTGSVWAMAVPSAVLALAEDIRKYNEKVEELRLVEKGFASESFGGYTYTLGSSAPPFMTEWARQISKKKARWRKI